MQVTTIGLDLAKHVFQVHGVDASGQVSVRRALRRKEVLLTTHNAKFAGFRHLAMAVHLTALCRVL